MKGIGKPEPLKYRDGFCRRIDDTNRLEYDGKQNVIILTCKGHYEDWRISHVDRKNGNKIPIEIGFHKGQG